MIFLKPNNFLEFFFQFIINLIFRLRLSIKKKLVYKVENNLFISGEFFETFQKINKNKKKSNIIFSTLNSFPLKKDYLRYEKKVWIFHNSDETFDLKMKKKLDFFKPKKCFSQNLIINKKNYHFIPIGIENSKFHNHGDVVDFLELRKKNVKKKSRILSGFRITNPNRLNIEKTIKKIDIIDETKGWNSFFYRRILLNYMFVVCPEGNGIDTHRMWEAFYLKTVPIIKKNKISRFLKNANLPILILNNWSDLLKFNENKLSKLYSSKKKYFNNDYLFQNYWKKIIK